MNAVRTVLGDVPADGLGAVNYHEHVFQISPLLPGDDLDDFDRSAQEFSLLRESGFLSVIDATPIGLGRRPGDLQEVSRRAGLTIIASTGAHRHEHYADDHWLVQLSEKALTDLFLSEVAIGMRRIDEPSVLEIVPTCRAGMVKTGIGYWKIGSFERRVLNAAAQTHRATGCPIMVHLEGGTAAHEVLDVLDAEEVDLNGVVLAHIDRNPDPFLHAELASRGAYLGYDGFARPKDHPDSAVIACLIEAAELGASDRILVGGDVARRTRYIAYGGIPGLAYLGNRVVPRLRALDSSLAEAVLVDNPARLLGRFE